MNDETRGNTQDPSHDSKVPAQPGAVETVGTRQGMFGVSGSGDTSGYGGLVQHIVLPGASRRPYGGWDGEGADPIEARLTSTEMKGAVEKGVLARGEITLHTRRNKPP